MCLLLVLVLAASLAVAAPAGASPTAVPPPLLQAWSDAGAISTDDDWSSVPGFTGYRGDGLTDGPGVDPRSVVADGSGTPVDVNANRVDPRAVGLPAGVTEFELANPVVAIQGSATAAAPHLVLALDTRGRAGVSVRLVLRDVDASAADAVSPVAIQYRVGGSGDFAAAPGGYVADATSGPSASTLVTPVRTTLPAAANDRALVQVRVITTNAAGQDEWIGVDDIEVTASPAWPPPAPPTCPGTPPVVVSPGPPAGSRPKPAPRPLPPALMLTELTLTPDTFTPTRRGAAIVRRGGTALRFRLSRAAVVRFQIIRAATSPEADSLKADSPEADSPEADSRKADSSEPDSSEPDSFDAQMSRGRFSARGRRGLNRLRFSGRIRGRALTPGTYVLRALATDRAGRESPPSTVRFRIRDNWD